jgi:DNA-binding MarR family transcriptional regulator
MTSKHASGPSEEDLDLEHRTAYRFAMLAEGSMRCLAGMFVPRFGLTIAGWRVMAIIGRYEPIFPLMVARLATMQADKVTRAVDQLVGAALVVRTVDAEDRRRIALSLTRRGRAIHDEIDQARRVIERRFLGVLDAAELRGFYQVMDKLDTHGRALFAGKASWAAIAEAEGISRAGTARAAAKSHRVAKAS